MKRLRAQRDRILSALCCVLFIVAQLAGFAHDARTDHVVCAEHGELVDVDRSTMTADANVDDCAQPSVRSVPFPKVLEHEHCCLATLHRGRAVTLPEFAPAVTLEPAPEIAPGPTPAARHCSSIPIFELAPKQSPPV